MRGRVEGVQAGLPADHEWLGRTVRTAIFKSPVEGRVAVGTESLAGDVQNDRLRHGGADKAVYAYAAEDIGWWSRQLGRALGPGDFGENLTVSGLDLAEAVIGERWGIGSAVLEVSQPRLPCAKLGLRLSDRTVPPRFSVAGRPGAYFRVVEEGQIGSGDTVTVERRPDHGVTVGMVFRVYFSDRHSAPRLLDAPELPPAWRTWAEEVRG